MDEVATARIRRVDQLTDGDLAGLCDVLVDCVAGGASVGFMHPLPAERAAAYWRGVGHGVESGERALLVAQDDDGIVGTVQLVLAQPDNQPHRADLSKMLVHRRGRRRGLGAALLSAAQDVAQQGGKTLLVLDTASSEAARLYDRLGWQRVGAIPGYALMPHGGLCDTVLFYRLLDGSGASSTTRGAGPSRC